MNQAFKLRFDQMRDSDPTNSKESAPTNGSDFYENSGHTRNLCLIWPDNKRYFFNYAYLIACEFDPTDDRNLIRLRFSSHTVSLYGYGLEALFMALLDHLPRLIMMIDPRYALDEENQVAQIVDMKVEKTDA